MRERERERERNRILLENACNTKGPRRNYKFMEIVGACEKQITFICASINQQAFTEHSLWAGLCWGIRNIQNRSRGSQSG
jgi:hypothetical protein